VSKPAVIARSVVTKQISIGVRTRREIAASR
jgi:hypothetical protein